MARNITLTLGVGLGADLGPNFNLTANVGSVTPSTATKSELTAGKSVSVDDAATQVTVTSTGTCTNSITQTIPCGGTTTTTTAATTTTTTTTGIVCELWEIINSNNTTTVQYYDCDNILQTMELLPEEILGCFSVNSNGFGENSPFSANFPITQNKCETTTTTTAATTTTTTTAGINYIAYPADKYVCDAPNCGAFVEATEIAFPDTFTPVINKWYSPPGPNGYAYQLTSTTPSAGPGLVMFETTFNTCGLACSV
jgi:hypothetical protein